MSTSVSLFEPFDGTKEDVVSYMERLASYLNFFDVPEEKRTDFFVASCGPRLFRLLKTVLRRIPARLAYQELTQLIERALSTKNLYLMERYNRDRGSFKEYLAVARRPEDDPRGAPRTIEIEEPFASAVVGTATAGVSNPVVNREPDVGTTANEADAGMTIEADAGTTTNEEADVDRVVMVPGTPPHISQSQSSDDLFDDEPRRCVVQNVVEKVSTTNVAQTQPVHKVKNKVPANNPPRSRPPVKKSKKAKKNSVKKFCRKFRAAKKRPVTTAAPCPQPATQSTQNDGGSQIGTQVVNGDGPPEKKGKSAPKGAKWFNWALDG